MFKGMRVTQIGNMWGFGRGALARLVEEYASERALGPADCAALLADWAVLGRAPAAWSATSPLPPLEGEVALGVGDGVLKAARLRAGRGSVAVRRTVAMPSGPAGLEREDIVRAGPFSDPEVRRHVEAILMSCDDVRQILLIGSTASGEHVRGFSDVDTVVVIGTDDEVKLRSYARNFRLVGRSLYRVRVDMLGFYESHWGAAFYPRVALLSEKKFRKRCSLVPLRFTMWNTKANSASLYLADGERDVREEMPAEWGRDMVEAWAFAPRFHLDAARRLVAERERKKSAYALSRSILQTARIAAWRRGVDVGSRYSELEDVLGGSGFAIHVRWALSARRRRFDVPLAETRRALRSARRAVPAVLARHTKRKAYKPPARRR